MTLSRCRSTPPATLWTRTAPKGSRAGATWHIFSTASRPANNLSGVAKPESSSTVRASDGSPASAGKRGSSAIAAGMRYRPATGFRSRGGRGLGEDRRPQLRRAGRADRGDAPHSGRGEALDRRTAIPACAELLHAAAGTGSAAAHGVHRLAAASHARRPRRRDVVRAARIGRDHGAVLAVRRARRRAGGGGAVLRPQGGGAGDRAGSGRAHRPAGAEERRDGGDRGRGLRRHLLLRRAVPADHPDGRADRPCRRQGGARGLPAPAAIPGSGPSRCPMPHRRWAKVRRRMPAPISPGRSRWPRSVCCSGSGPFSHCCSRSGATTCSPGSGCSSARWPWSRSAAPTPCSPTWRSRRSRRTAGSSPARCWMASAWPKRRPAR